jgi:hypothetical protein
MARIEGIEEVLENLRTETKAIVGSSARGVVKAGLLIMRESQKLTPVRLGNLRNSRYLISSVPGLAPNVGGGSFKGKDSSAMSSGHTQAKGEATVGATLRSKGGKAPTVAVGYSAVYALSVHENPSAGSGGNTQVADKARSGTKIPLSQIHSKKGQWKFLEAPLKSNASKILEIIKKEAKVD